MKDSKRYSIVGVAAFIGVIGGFILATPEMYTVASSIPGIGFDRQCNPMDSMCNTVRNREIYTGQGFGYNSFLDEGATLRKKIIFSGIGSVGLGLSAFAVTHFMAVGEAESSNKT